MVQTYLLPYMVGPTGLGGVDFRVALGQKVLIQKRGSGAALGNPLAYLGKNLSPGGLGRKVFGFWFPPNGANQWGFSGGRKNYSDPTNLASATREFLEETAVDLRTSTDRTNAGVDKLVEKTLADSSSFSFYVAYLRFAGSAMTSLLNRIQINIDGERPYDGEYRSFADFGIDDALGSIGPWAPTTATWQKTVASAISPDGDPLTIGPFNTAFGDYVRWMRPVTLPEAPSTRIACWQPDSSRPSRRRTSRAPAAGSTAARLQPAGTARASSSNVTLSRRLSPCLINPHMTRPIITTIMRPRAATRALIATIFRYPLTA